MPMRNRLTAPPKADQSSRCRNRAAAPASPSPVLGEMDLSPFPEWYAMHVEGNCCLPEIPSGCHVMCTTTQAPGNGDFVAIHFTPEAAARYGFEAWVKRLVYMIGCRSTGEGLRAARGGNVRPCVIVEQLNPPRRYTVLCSDIRAVHFCGGPVPAERVVRNPKAEKRRAAWKAAQAAQVAA